MNASFSFARFQLFLRRDLYDRRKRLLSLASGFLIFCLLLIGFSVLLDYQSRPSGYASSHLVPVLAPLFLLTLVIGAHIGICETFAGLTSKEQRINFLMAPASMLEKFAARTLQSTLLVWFAMPLLLLLADAIIALLVFAFGIPYSSVTLPFFEDMIFKLPPAEVQWVNGVYIVGWYHTFIHISMCLASLTTYILGASVFRRYPFILTSLTLFMLTLVLTISISVGGMQLLGDRQFNLTGDEILPYAPAMIHGWFILNLVWTVGITFWVYRRFQRMQVIPPHSFGL